MINTDVFFKYIYNDLMTFGKEYSPRGMKIKEIEHYTYKLPPYYRFANFKSRKLNIDYIKKEFLWYLRGDLYDLSICEHAKIWKDIVVKDSFGQGYLNSNYGYYIFKTGAFDKVVYELKMDKDSRRASISILGSLPSHNFPEVKDVPCTYSLNFRIRRDHDGRDTLKMSVHMRSQDAVFGMGNDLPCFSFIHEMVYTYLKEHYPDLEMGLYYHTADSFHVYERHFGMLNQILQGDEFESIEVPRIHSVAECDFLRRLDAYRNAAIEIPEEYKFTKWLLGV